jgi:hypothetical protein
MNEAAVMSRFSNAAGRAFRSPHHTAMDGIAVCPTMTTLARHCRARQRTPRPQRIFGHGGNNAARAAGERDAAVLHRVSIAYGPGAP